ncbi:membrane protein containing SecA DEAD-like domain protein [Candidatus Omnitrophus magneticus]|uniref:Membrane protein containing SecA DEAD-like domain protein n=1 Tax=Candidatus Omnitrophus magneticus TaxID=1609969 RepID=A0A0F0CPZ4_9BACT|nr:membrane protein containing SecA DEAD-like domain protein [Candidatus Omnitrophus magneticus]
MVLHETTERGVILELTRKMIMLLLGGVLININAIIDEDVIKWLDGKIGTANGDKITEDERQDIFERANDVASANEKDFITKRIVEIKQQEADKKAAEEKKATEERKAAADKKAVEEKEAEKEEEKEEKEEKEKTTIEKIEEEMKNAASVEDYAILLLKRENEALRLSGQMTSEVRAKIQENLENMIFIRYGVSLKEVFGQEGAASLRDQYNYVRQNKLMEDFDSASGKLGKAQEELEKMEDEIRKLENDLKEKEKRLKEMKDTDMLKKSLEIEIAALKEQISDKKSEKDEKAKEEKELRGVVEKQAKDLKKDSKATVDAILGATKAKVGLRAKFSKTIRNSKVLQKLETWLQKRQEAKRTANWAKDGGKKFLDILQKSNITGAVEILNNFKKEIFGINTISNFVDFLKANEMTLEAINFVMAEMVKAESTSAVNLLLNLRESAKGKELKDLLVNRMNIDKDEKIKVTDAQGTIVEINTTEELLSYITKNVTTLDAAQLLSASLGKRGVSMRDMFNNFNKTVGNLKNNLESAENKKTELEKKIKDLTERKATVLNLLEHDSQVRVETHRKTFAEIDSKLNSAREELQSTEKIISELAKINGLDKLSNFLARSDCLAIGINNKADFLEHIRESLIKQGTSKVDAENAINSFLQSMVFNETKDVNSLVRVLAFNSYGKLSEFLKRTDISSTIRTKQGLIDFLRGQADANGFTNKEIDSALKDIALKETPSLRDTLINKITGEKLFAGLRQSALVWNLRKWAEGNLAKLAGKNITKGLRVFFYNRIISFSNTESFVQWKGKELYDNRKSLKAKSKLVLAELLMNRITFSIFERDAKDYLKASEAAVKEAQDKFLEGLGASQQVTSQDVARAQTEITEQIGKLEERIEELNKIIKSEQSNEEQKSRAEKEKGELVKLMDNLISFDTALDSINLNNLEQARALVFGATAYRGLCNELLEKSKDLAGAKDNLDIAANTEKDEVTDNVEAIKGMIEGIKESLNIVLGAVWNDKKNLAGGVKTNIILRGMLTMGVINNTEQGKKFLTEYLTAKDKELQEEYNQNEGKITKEFKEKAYANIALAIMAISGFPGIRLEQFSAGDVMVRGNNIAELKTGQGKTTVARLASYIAQFRGAGKSMVVQPTELFAIRDGKESEKIFALLGKGVGIIKQDMTEEDRQAAYKKDIVYVNGQQFAFDVLHDLFQVNEKDLPNKRYLNIDAKTRAEYQETLKKEFFALADEVDSVIIDQATTKYIMSMGKGREVSPERNKEIAALLGIARGIGSQTGERKVKLLSEKEAKERELKKTEDAESKYSYIIDKYNKQVTRKMSNEELIKQLKDAGIEIKDESDTKEIEKWARQLDKAVEAIYCWEENKNYLMQTDPMSNETSIILVSNETGVSQFGQRLQDGLHSFLEAKHDLAVHEDTKTEASAAAATIYRMIGHFCGMTGTATQGNTMEFLAKTYGLSVNIVPAHEPTVRTDVPAKVVSDEEYLKNFIKEVIDAAKVGAPMLVPASESIALAHVLHATTNLYSIAAEMAKVKDKSSEEYKKLLEKYNTAKDSLIEKYASYTNKEGSENRASVEKSLSTTLDFIQEIADGKIEAPEIALQEIFDAKTGSDFNQQQKIVGSAGGKSVVTIATSIAGRGTDIGVSGHTGQTGLRVIGVDLYNSERVEMQLRGRSGRKGQAGVSTQIVSNSQYQSFIERAFKDNPKYAKNLAKTKTVDLTTARGQEIARKWIARAQSAIEKKQHEQITSQAKQDEIEFLNQLAVRSFRDQVENATARITGEAEVFIETKIAEIIKNPEVKNADGSFNIEKVANEIESVFGATFQGADFLKDYSKTDKDMALAIKIMVDEYIIKEARNKMLSNIQGTMMNAFTKAGQESGGDMKKFEELTNKAFIEAIAAMNALKFKELSEKDIEAHIKNLKEDSLDRKKEKEQKAKVVIDGKDLEVNIKIESVKINGSGNNKGVIKAYRDMRGEIYETKSGGKIVVIDGIVVASRGESAPKIGEKVTVENYKKIGEQLCQAIVIDIGFGEGKDIVAINGVIIKEIEGKVQAGNSINYEKSEISTNNVSTKDIDAYHSAHAREQSKGVEVNLSISEKDVIKGKAEVSVTGEKKEEKIAVTYVARASIAEKFVDGARIKAEFEKRKMEMEKEGRKKAQKESTKIEMLGEEEITLNDGKTVTVNVVTARKEGGENTKDIGQVLKEQGKQKKIVLTPPDEEDRKVFLQSEEFKKALGTETIEGEVTIISAKLGENGEIKVDVYRLSEEVATKVAGIYEEIVKTGTKEDMATMEEMFDKLFGTKTGTTEIAGHIVATLEKDGRRVIVDLGHKSDVNPLTVKMINSAGADKDSAKVIEKNGVLIVAVGDIDIPEGVKLADGAIIWDSKLTSRSTVARGAIVRNTVLTNKNVSIENGAVIDGIDDKLLGDTKKVETKQALYRLSELVDKNVEARAKTDNNAAGRYEIEAVDILHISKPEGWFEKRLPEKFKIKAIYSGLKNAAQRLWSQLPMMLMRNKNMMNFGLKVMNFQKKLAEQADKFLSLFMKSKQEEKLIKETKKEYEQYQKGMILLGDLTSESELAKEFKGNTLDEILSYKATSVMVSLLEKAKLAETNSDKEGCDKYLEQAGRIIKFFKAVGPDKKKKDEYRRFIAQKLEALKMEVKILTMQGKTKEAMDAIKSLLNEKAISNDINFLESAGDIALAQGEADLSTQCFERALKKSVEQTNATVKNSLDRMVDFSKELLKESPGSFAVGMFVLGIGIYFTANLASLLWGVLAKVVSGLGLGGSVVGGSFQEDKKQALLRAKLGDALQKKQELLGKRDKTEKLDADAINEDLKRSLGIKDEGAKLEFKNVLDRILYFGKNIIGTGLLDKHSAWVAYPLIALRSAATLVILASVVQISAASLGALWGSWAVWASQTAGFWSGIVSFIDAHLGVIAGIIGVNLAQKIGAPKEKEQKMPGGMPDLGNLNKPKQADKFNMFKMLGFGKQDARLTHPFQKSLDTVLKMIPMIAGPIGLYFGVVTMSSLLTISLITGIVSLLNIFIPQIFSKGGAMWENRNLGGRSVNELETALNSEHLTPLEKAEIYALLANADEKEVDGILKRLLAKEADLDFKARIESSTDYIRQRLIDYAIQKALGEPEFFANTVMLNKLFDLAKKHDALKLLETALKSKFDSDKTNKNIATILARVSSENKNFEEAVNYILQSMGVEEGIKYENLKTGDDAVLKLMEDKENAALVIELAKNLRELKDEKTALNILKKAKNADKSNIEVMTGLHDLYVSSGELGKAAELLKEALLLSPKDEKLLKILSQFAGTMEGNVKKGKAEKAESQNAAKVLMGIIAQGADTALIEKIVDVIEKFSGVEGMTRSDFYGNVLDNILKNTGVLLGDKVKLIEKLTASLKNITEKLDKKESELLIAGYNRALGLAKNAVVKAGLHKGIAVIYMNLKTSEGQKQALANIDKSKEFLKNGLSSQALWSELYLLEADIASMSPSAILARDLEEQGEFDKAKELYKEAIKNHPTDWESNLRLAGILLNKEKYQDAEDYFNKAAELNSIVKELYGAGFLEVYVKNKNIEGAIEILNSMSQNARGKVSNEVKKELLELSKEKADIANREAVDANKKVREDRSSSTLDTLETALGKAIDINKVLLFSEIDTIEKSRIDAELRDMEQQLSDVRTARENFYNEEIKNFESLRKKLFSDMGKPINVETIKEIDQEIALCHAALLKNEKDIFKRSDRYEKVISSFLRGGEFENSKKYLNQMAKEKGAVLTDLQIAGIEEAFNLGLKGDKDIAEKSSVLSAYTALISGRLDTAADIINKLADTIADKKGLKEILFSKKEPEKIEKKELFESHDDARAKWGEKLWRIV